MSVSVISNTMGWVVAAISASLRMIFDLSHRGHIVVSRLNLVARSPSMSMDDCSESSSLYDNGPWDGKSKKRQRAKGRERLAKGNRYAPFGNRRPHRNIK